MSNVPLLSVENLSVEFEGDAGTARVLNGVSFTISRSETLGVVGESGCGKSMTALSILQLIPVPPGRISHGSIELDGKDLLKASERDVRAVRGNSVAMVFQEPMTSLNPVFTVGEQIIEALTTHQDITKKAARQRAIDLLKAVGIPAPESRVDEYPHQLSGGMRQRVMIAIAISCDPALLIADEPTTALDVTVQAQIFDLLRDLLDRLGMGLMLITHDMGVVSEMTDRVIVMYGGHVVETGATDTVLSNPRHPYTMGLVACVPTLDTDLDDPGDLPEIRGVVPSIWELQTGCPFADRCDEVLDRCRTTMPEPAEVGHGHFVSCWQRSGGISDA